MKLDKRVAMSALRIAAHNGDLGHDEMKESLQAVCQIVLELLDTNATIERPCDNCGCPASDHKNNGPGLTRPCKKGKGGCACMGLYYKSEGQIDGPDVFSPSSRPVEDMTPAAWCVQNCAPATPRRTYHHADCVIGKAESSDKDKPARELKCKGCGGSGMTGFGSPGFCVCPEGKALAAEAAASSAKVCPKCSRSRDNRLETCHDRFHLYTEEDFKSDQSRPTFVGAKIGVCLDEECVNGGFYNNHLGDPVEVKDPENPPTKCLGCSGVLRIMEAADKVTCREWWKCECSECETVQAGARLAASPKKEQP